MTGKIGFKKFLRERKSLKDNELEESLAKARFIMPESDLTVPTSGNRSLLYF
jgi:hypothetical protein